MKQSMHREIPKIDLFFFITANSERKEKFIFWISRLKWIFKIFTIEMLGWLLALRPIVSRVT